MIFANSKQGIGKKLLCCLEGNLSPELKTDMGLDGFINLTYMTNIRSLHRKMKETQEWGGPFRRGEWVRIQLRQASHYSRSVGGLLIILVLSTEAPLVCMVFNFDLCHDTNYSSSPLWYVSLNCEYLVLLTVFLSLFCGSNKSFWCSCSSLFSSVLHVHLKTYMVLFELESP